MNKEEAVQISCSQKYIVIRLIHDFSNPACVSLMFSPETLYFPGAIINYLTFFTAVSISLLFIARLLCISA